jgi:hypothetical protein
MKGPTVRTSANAILASQLAINASRSKMPTPVPPVLAAGWTRVGAITRCSRGIRQPRVDIDVTGRALRRMEKLERPA